MNVTKHNVVKMSERMETNTYGDRIVEYTFKTETEIYGRQLKFLFHLLESLTSKVFSLRVHPLNVFSIRLRLELL